MALLACRSFAPSSVAPHHAPIYNAGSPTHARLASLSSISSLNAASTLGKPLGSPRSVRALSIRAKSEEAEVSPLEYGASISGLVSVPVVAWSLYTLKLTGCGLPPGPGGSLGALEGVSYLVITAIVGWSLYKKVKTGTGLPNGPFGLLGAVEGLSYLTILAAIIVFALQLNDYGFIPPPVPGDQCFG